VTQKEMSRRSKIPMTHPTGELIAHGGGALGVRRFHHQQNSVTQPAKPGSENERLVVVHPAEPHAEAAAILRSRVYNALEIFTSQTKGADVGLLAGARHWVEKIQCPATARNRPAQGSEDADTSIEVAARRYAAEMPKFSFKNLILPELVLHELLAAVNMLKVSERVFETWGLKKVEPFPRTALNFHGPSGTGKTLAAHAIAAYLGKRILLGSYADIESKFHGDGPKNVQAIFYAAERDDAVLFIDEAESLLSKRLLNVTQGSESAINSMRSQLLIRLERFRGTVIFATNLVQSYDSAFETRIRNVEFVVPDESCRKRIWEAHLPAALPLADDVNLDTLARETDGFCGRDIKNAVVDAAIRAALRDVQPITIRDLMDSAARLRSARTSQESLRPPPTGCPPPLPPGRCSTARTRRPPLA
jgi:AAA+ superfamily predicted ATPase